MNKADGLGSAVLITGTGLGVGKTFVAAGLARLLRNHGVDVGVMKPIETGWPAEGGRWPADADKLREAADVDDPAEDVVPYVFEEMVAPQVAADRLRQPIEPERIQNSLMRLRQKHRIVLVEGVGGLATPLDDGLDLAGLASICGLPLLVVTGAHIGTLNQTFLTVHYARSQGLNVLGVIANLYDDTLDDPTVSTNAQMIERMCDVPVLGVIPFHPEADTLEDVLSTCEKCFDCKQLMRLLELSGEVQSC